MVSDQIEDLILSSEEEATHVKITEKIYNVPNITEGKVYQLYTARYDDCAAIDFEQYIKDDSGNDNFAFAMCCKKEFWRQRK